MTSKPLPEVETVPASDLTEEQRQAVEQAAGPLLVLAGAGTGKTRVIAGRVAHLIQEREVPPEAILALTFSRKAAGEMAERLERRLGGAALNLTVTTFHGFCSRLLQDEALAIGLSPRLRMLDRLQSWIFFRSLLPELKLKFHPVPTDPEGVIDAFLRFIGRAKDELIGPDAYAAFAAGLKDPEERQRAEEVARVYRTYQDRLERARCMDFGDLVFRAVEALRRDSALLRRLQERYRQVLIDEFQDTNVAQIELVRFLAGSGGGLCAVGDDDQAIYRFRGASFASFLLLKHAYPELRTIRLTRNFRSTVPILAAAEALIRNNEDRYDPEKRLWTDADSKQPVEVVACADAETEAGEVLRRLIELKRSGALAFGWGAAAVLYRAHAHRRRLVELLTQAGIPFFVHGGVGLFDPPVIRYLVALLKGLQDPADGVSLFHLLSHPMWGIPLEDLIELNRRAKAEQLPLRRLLERFDGKGADPLSAEAAEGLVRFRSELKRLERSVRSGMPALIRAITEQSAFRMLFLLEPEPGGEDPLAALGRFLRFTHQILETMPEARQLDAFLWIVESAIQSGVDPSETGTPPDPNRVQLMTVHQAKGLEFDWVFLLGMEQGRFPARNRPEGIPFPLELMKESLPKGDSRLQEERRLAYVACTRARRGLWLMTQDRAYHRPSPFVKEIQAGAQKHVRSLPSDGSGAEGAAAPVPATAGGLALEREVLQILREIRHLPETDEAGHQERLRRIERLTAELRAASVPPPAAVPAALKAEARYSFSQLDSYRDCPLKFKYRYLYQIPVRPTPAMNFGTDLHVCLEAFYRQVINGRIPTLAEMEETFRRSFQPGRYGAPGQEQSYQQAGLEMLRAYYRSHDGRFEAPLMLEQPFLLPVGETRIKGFVDRIDPVEGGGVEIVDYKSGRPKEKASAEEQLQLRIYALAAREVLGLDPKRISFYYLKNNRKLSFEPTDAELEETRAWVLQTVAQIRSGDFTPAPSPFKCRFCDFRNLCPASQA